MTLFDLSGRVAIVTGGNGGIGLGMARGLAGAGAAVVVPRAIREIGGGGGRAEALGVKSASSRSTSPSRIRAAPWSPRCCDRFGRLDILVNNAGMSIRKPPEAYEDWEWQQVLDTNLNGAFACCQAAHAPMKRQGGGKIINIGSMMSIFGGAYRGALLHQQGRHRAAEQVARAPPGPRTTSRSTRCCRAGSTPS